ncbi:hypothetical protein ACLI4Y_12280 [Natrialbaceae archaeon A-CW3]
MRAIQTCDFCERTATGAFEVVPQALEPSESEQRRVVLCGACQARLESLFEPLYHRLLDGNQTGGEQSGTSTDAGRKRGTAPPDGITLGAPTSSLETDADTDAPGEPAETPIESTDAESADRPGDSNTSGEASAEDDSVEANETEVPASDAGDSSNGTNSSGHVDSTTGSTSGDGSDSSEPAPTRERNRPPAAYGKVLRLLSNREFPMARSDVEGLAAGAYDLEGHEVEAIIDHAIETGEFVEDGSQLRRS